MVTIINNGQMDSSITNTSTADWFLDITITNQMTLDLASLFISDKYNSGEQVIVGNGKGIPIARIGKTTLTFSNKYFHLKDILLIPHIKHQLLV